MNTSFEKIICPSCSSKIDSEKFKESQNLTRKCECGFEYHLDSGCLKFLQKEHLSEKVLRTSNSFSQQWNFFDYEDEDFKTWDWNKTDRLKRFLIEIDETPSSLNGKKILDAGCGNGVLTNALTLFGSNVVGSDISKSVIKASSLRNSLAYNPDKVFFVQSDLNSLPFEKETFDFIYSSGVLHHTPDTRNSFESVVKHLKKDGKIFIWLYRKTTLSMFVSEPLRKLTNKVELWVSLGICKLLAYPFKFIRIASRYMGIKTYPNKTIDELVISLHDTLTPQYAYHYYEDEVLGWFSDLGFKKTKVTIRDSSGFGIIGTYG
tara:strand:- start:318 stop:1274 length:957 start_codon:yes stop_codon:yes gene_type:complete